MSEAHEITEAVSCMVQAIQGLDDDGVVKAWEAFATILGIRSETRVSATNDVDKSAKKISDALKIGIEESRAEAALSLLEDKDLVIKALQDFKDYVHTRLDAAGVPENPQPPKHALEGCRIGDRLDWVLGREWLRRGEQLEATMGNIYREGKHPLPTGMYRLFWKSGGSDLAAVGSMHDGTRWFASCNWVSGNNEKPFVASTDWKLVDYVRRVEVKESA